MNVMQARGAVIGEQRETQPNRCDAHIISQAKKIIPSTTYGTYANERVYKEYTLISKSSEWVAVVRSCRIERGCVILLAMT